VSDEDAAAQAREVLERGDVRRVRVEIADTDGNLRGKYVSPAKALKAYGTTVSDVFYTLTVREDVFEAPLTGQDTGFPDVIASPDLSTLRRVPWQPDVYAVIADMTTKRGEPLGVDPRGALRATERRLAEAGYEALVGVEYELYLFEGGAEADALMRAGRHRELTPMGREWQAYSLWRFVDGNGFLHAIDEQLRDYGVEIEAWSTELGYGMVECATPPLPPLQAADTAARLKLALKELAKQHGLVATFIAKWDTAQSGSSGHVHQSLLRDGRNALWGGEPGTLSETGRHYLGGLLALAPELSAFSTPNVNSYRRPSPELWAPTNATWGHDNRQAAIRVISLGEASTRFEYRRPGADLNPYLAIASCLDSGLHGVQQGLEPPAESAVRAFDDPDAPPFPPDLEAAAAALDGSALARQWYGDDLVTHYALSRRAEAGFVRALADAQVPAHELTRYFETA
jgi:glutamine synthetase